MSSGQVDAKNDPAQDNCADRYIGPFQAACESRVPKLVEVGLDSIHYLIGMLYTFRLKLSSYKSDLLKFNYHNSNMDDRAWILYW